jgi:hypothetical protein
MFNQRQLWEPFEIKQDHTLELHLGLLDLWIHRGEQEWHVANENKSLDEGRCEVGISADAFPQDRRWTRWMINDNVDQIHLRPRLPDRPVIVRPEMPMCLMPKQSVQFFVGIPIWLSVSFGASHPDVIEIPSLKLSNSWFGSVTEGELCYALKTTAKLRQEDLLPHAHRVVFPLEIRNTSEEKLNFERLCLRVQNLDIYQGSTRMWTNKGRVIYRGAENWSRIVYGRNAPDFDREEKRISTAREPMSRGTLLKTFDNLKLLADF